MQGVTCVNGRFSSQCMVYLGDAVPCALHAGAYASGGGLLVRVGGNEVMDVVVNIAASIIRNNSADAMQPEAGSGAGAGVYVLIGWCSGLERVRGWLSLDDAVATCRCCLDCLSPSRRELAVAALIIVFPPHGVNLP